MDFGQFGAPVGKISSPSTSDLKNEFSSIPDVSIADYVKSSVVLPRDVTTGVTRGTQSIVTDNGRVNLGYVGEKAAETGTGLQVVDSANNPRLFGGQFADGSVKIKLSQLGYNVMTATDDHLIWSSDFNTYKIVKSVPISVTVNYTSGSSAFGTASVAHGLSFQPSYEAYIIIPSAIAGLGILPSTNLPNPALIFGVIGATITIFALITVSVDATNVNIAAQLGTGYATANYTFTANVALKRETQSF